MKITIYKAHHGRRHYWETKLHKDLKGTGTQADPFIIDPSDNIPSSCAIRDQKNHFVIKGIKKRDLLIVNCQNFSIVDCKFRYCNFRGSDNINIENMQIYKWSKIDHCTNITVNQCYYNKLKVLSSSKIIVKDSYIYRLYEKRSIQNNYNSNIIKKLESSVKKDTFLSRNTLTANKIEGEKYRIKKKNEYLLLVKLILLYLAIVFSSLLSFIIFPPQTAVIIILSITGVSTMALFIYVILWERFPIFYFKRKFQK